MKSACAGLIRQHSGFHSAMDNLVAGEGTLVVIITQVDLR